MQTNKIIYISDRIDQTYKGFYIDYVIEQDKHVQVKYKRFDSLKKAITFKENLIKQERILT